MTTVASGQTLNVTSGQTSTGVIVDSGGTLDVFAGGKVSSTVDSGFVNVSGGKAVSTIVVSDGVEQVLAGIDSRRRSAAAALRLSIPALRQSAPKSKAFAAASDLLDARV